MQWGLGIPEALMIKLTKLKTWNLLEFAIFESTSCSGINGLF